LCTALWAAVGASAWKPPLSNGSAMIPAGFNPAPEKPTHLANEDN
jgi:hypothetical protein